MGKQSRRKKKGRGPGMRATIEQLRDARQWVAREAAKGTLLAPAVIERAHRTAAEVARHRPDLTAATPDHPEIGQARRIKLLHQGVGLARDVFLDGVRRGLSRPVVFVCDLWDPVGRHIAATADPMGTARATVLWDDLPDHLQGETVPMVLVALPRTVALELLRDYSPETYAYMLEPELHHRLFPLCVLSAGGVRYALADLDGNPIPTEPANPRTP